MKFYFKDYFINNNETIFYIFLIIILLIIMYAIYFTFKEIKNNDSK